MKKFVVLLGLVVLSFGCAQECEEGQRLVQHDLGDTCIPENPQRIATDNLDTLGLMLALGIEPAGHPHALIDALVSTAPELEELGQQFNANAVDIGSPMNAEAVLLADPDLILVENSETIDQLQEIAPVVAYDVYANIQETREMNWYDPMMFWADVLNVTDDAEIQRDIVESRLATLSDLAGDTTVSIIHMNNAAGTLLAGSPMWIYEQLARAAGLERPERQTLTLAEHEARYDTAWWGNYSLEELDTVDADVLIMTTSRGEPEAEQEVAAFTKRLESNPLWSSLSAVQEGEFYQVNYSQWISFDFASVNRTVDDLFRYVAGVDPQEVSPNPFLTGDTYN